MTTDLTALLERVRAIKSYSYPVVYFGLER
jgi:hypothetical protein